MSGFDKFLRDKNGSEISAVSTQDLEKELDVREKSENIFPLDVFHDSIKPFITALNDKFDIPRSYIGTSLLSAYSAAIGTSYAVLTNGSNYIYLPTWCCLVGISNAGKSLVQDIVFKPLYDIQIDFDKEWVEDSESLPDQKRINAKMKTVIYRDAHIATLVRSVMPDNPKGITKFADEIMEWINGMNQLSKKEGADEQFWLSSWNGKNYSGIRANKVKFSIPRPFVNVLGGIQYSILFKLFAKDRDTTGFIFRLLFATPDLVKIAEPDIRFNMPAELLNSHTTSIKKLYFDLPVDDPYQEPNKCILSEEAIDIYKEWTDRKIRKVNVLDDEFEKEIHSGIYGKIKEYVLRFAGILTVVDRAFEMDESNPFDTFRSEEMITGKTMERAIRLGEYFYKSAANVYEAVQTKMTAPADVLIAATLFRQKASYATVAKALYGDEKHKQKAFRAVKKWIREYPKVFGAMT